MMPQIVDITAKTGQHIVDPVTSWQTPDGPFIVEHLAGMGINGNLLVFYWSPRQDWTVVNVTNITGQRIASPVTSWVTGNVEHLAGKGPDNSLLVFWWTPATNWQVVNVTNITGENVDSNPTVYQLADAQENVELLGAKNPSNSLLLYWWKPSLDWQAMNISEITGEQIISTPQAWIVPSGTSSIVEHFAAESNNNRFIGVLG
jgi:hypothetical protein